VQGTIDSLTAHVAVLDGDGRIVLTNHDAARSRESSGWASAAEGSCRPVDEGDVPASLRGALGGAMISGVFGSAWTEWGASGLSGSLATVIRVAGIVIGAGIVLWCGILWRAAAGGGSGGSGLMFGSRGYRLVVILEVAAIIGGNALLGASGHPDYIIAWVAAVVGIHFVAFGRLFWSGFYWLGAALISAGIAGALVGLAGGGSGAVEATSGLAAAVSLFSAGGSTIIKS
jgi:hypothetical protein